MMRQEALVTASRWDNPSWSVIIRSEDTALT